MESRMEAYLNAAISGNTENLPNPISRIDFLLCELIKTLGESGASIEEVEKIVTDKVAEIVADAPEDFDTLKELSDWIYTHEESAAEMNSAIQSNTNSIESLMTDVDKKAYSNDVYDKATADSRFLGIDATADKAVADENGSNISETFSAVKNDIALNRTTLGVQCKNLLNETEYLSSIKTATNGTLSKSDNSITLTATSNDCYTAPFFVGDNGYRIPVSPNTTYILSWESDNSNYGIIHVFMNGIVSKQQAANNSVTKYLKFTTDIDATFITIRFNVRNSGDSITYSNIMLRYADIQDDTYEPYKESVDERLIQNKSDIAVNKTTLGYQCKNLFKNTAVSQTGYGVTFTVNNDKSITTNGTATQTIYFNMGSFYFEADKQYILNGCSSGGSETKYFLAYDGMPGHQYDIGNSSTFSVSESATKTMLLVIKSGQTVSNLTFKPMLRYADIIDDTYEPYQPSLQEQIIGAYFPMTIQKGIGDSTDLNTITEVGNYICWSGSSASTMSNCPTTSGAFRLIVTNRFQDCNESDNLRYQWIIPNNQDSVFYYRRPFDTNTNSFGSWYSFGGTIVS